jgi:hypothetical protein
MEIEREIFQRSYKPTVKKSFAEIVNNPKTILHDKC